MGRFHAKDGLNFERDHRNGGVIITVEKPVRDAGGAFSGAQVVAERIELDADSWASVVASVSALGEGLGSWNLARAFHASHPSVAL